MSNEDLEPFLECHYYDDGLRHRSFQLGSARPAWAPTAEWVGFRNEFELDKDDFAIELVKFRTGGQDVLWFALYVFAEDAEFGDRKNYAGLGVWLPSSIITAPSPLVESLQALHKELGKDISATSSTVFKQFLSDGFLQKVSVQYSTLPSALSGLKGAKAPLMQTELKAIYGEHANFDALFSELILAAQYFPSKSDASRLLIRLTSREARPAKSTDSGIELVTSAKFSRPIASRIPTVFAELNEDLEETQKQLIESQKTAEQLTAELNAKTADLARSEAEKEAVATRAAQFEKAFNESDEQKRFVQLYDAIGDLKASIKGSQIEQARQNAELTGGVTREVAKLQGLEHKIDRIARNRSQTATISHRPGVDKPDTIFLSSYILSVIALVIGIVSFAAGYWIGSPDEVAGVSAEDVSVAERQSVPIQIIPAGENFACKPHRVWDGDGPIWCEEGPRVRLAGISARELDGSCSPGHPCPDMGGEQARDTLASLLGEVVDKANKGHLVIEGARLSCLSTGGAGGDRTGAFCETEGGVDLSCELIEQGAALKWDKFWDGHTC